MPIEANHGSQPPRGPRVRLGVIRDGQYVPAPLPRDRHGVARAALRIEVDPDAGFSIEKIHAALARAKELVSDAIAALASPMRERARQALIYNFHTTERDDIEDIRDAYGEIQDGLAGDFTIEVEAEDEGRLAYVPDYLIVMGDIHLAQPWFRQSAEMRAANLVHEASHKFAGTGDEAPRYSSGPTDAYRNLSPDDAINNAYSYQWFALDAPHYRTVTSEPLTTGDDPPPEYHLMPPAPVEATFTGPRTPLVVPTAPAPPSLTTPTGVRAPGEVPTAIRRRRRLRRP